MDLVLLHSTWSVVDFAEVKQKLANYKIGQVVSVEVRAKNDHGVICQTEDGVQCFATKDNMEGECVVYLLFENLNH